MEDRCRNVCHLSLKGEIILSILKQVNLAVAFFLELAVLAALAYWGYQNGQGLILQIGLCILAPALAIGVWAVWGAPKSTRRLSGIGLLILRIVFFGAGALALFAAGQPTLGVLFTVLITINLILVYAWHQDTGTATV